MSLDVYLEVPVPPKVEPQTRIFIRENGATRELTRAEWDEKFPGREPVTIEDSENDHVYSRNITHNLNKMAEAAGIYEELWRPDELFITSARELIEPLTEGLARLCADPEKFKAFDPGNGWGDYDGLVAFVSDYLRACTENPDALVRVSR